MQNLTSTGMPDDQVSQHLSWLAAGEVPGAHNAGEDARGLSSTAVLRAAVRRVLEVYLSAT